MKWNLSNRLVDGTSAYIRKIVASSFEKGVYEPPPSSISETHIPFRSKSTLSLASASTSGRTIRPGSSQRKPVASAIDDDDCLLCCSSKLSHGFEVPNSDKLSIQRGPAISIKADLCVQTSRIVDIQPTKDPLLISGGGSIDNVANFEFHHESFAYCKDDSAAAEELTKAPGTKDATTSISGLVMQPVDEQRVSICSPASVPPEPEPKLDVSSDVDFSLGEPTIITELDVLLSQQRTIIRKVHQSSQALDELLRKSATSQDRSSRSPRSPRSPRSSVDGDEYSAESFDSVHSHDSLMKASSAAAASSRDSDSCKSNAGFIENLKSSSLRIPKPSNLTVDTNTDVTGHKEIGDKQGGGTRLDKEMDEREVIDSNDGKNNQDETREDGGSTNVNANTKEFQMVSSSDISTNKENERGSIKIGNNDNDEEIEEKELGDSIDVKTNKDIDEKEETGDSLHKTSHLIDSLSDDQSFRQLSTQLIVQSQLDSTAMNDNQRNSSTSGRSLKADSTPSAAAQRIVSPRENSVDLGRATARGHSCTVSNNR